MSRAALLRKVVRDLGAKRVAYECDVSQQAVANWEEGAEPKARHVLKLAELVGGSPQAQLALARQLAGLD